MPSIEITLKELSKRGSQIQKLLRPISSLKTGPAWRYRPVGRDTIIAMHQGSPTKSDYRDWRFSTLLPKYRAMYFEKWNEVDAEVVCLDRAYLTIYRTDRSDWSESEFLCLHCDPNEQEGPHSEYKKGPHLHIKAAEHPFPHAHIALNRLHLQEVLLSVDSVSTALESAIIMLKEQILEALKKE